MNPSTWLDVPYSEKNAAKDRGARWDPEERRWYAPASVDISGLRRWMMSARIYLQVPYEEKDEARGLGARWDPSCRAWFISDDMDPNPFADWIGPTRRS